MTPNSVSLALISLQFQKFMYLLGLSPEISYMVLILITAKSSNSLSHSNLSPICMLPTLMTSQLLFNLTQKSQRQSSNHIDIISLTFHETIFFFVLLSKFRTLTFFSELPQKCHILCPCVLACPMSYGSHLAYCYQSGQSKQQVSVKSFCGSHSHHVKMHTPYRDKVFCDSFPVHLSRFISHSLS